MMELIKMKYNAVGYLIVSEKKKIGEGGYRRYKMYGYRNI